MRGDCVPTVFLDGVPIRMAGTTIDEVFIGSCMTNIGHFRAAAKVLEQNKGPIPTRLWVAPPTRMDASELTTAPRSAAGRMPGVGGAVASSGLRSAS